MTPTTQQPSTYSRWNKIEDALVWAEICHKLRSFKNDTWGRELREGPIYPRRYQTLSKSYYYDRNEDKVAYKETWNDIRLEMAINIAVENAKQTGMGDVCFHGISNLIDLNY